MQDLFERERLLQFLKTSGLQEWSETLQQLCHARQSNASHGTLEQWTTAWQQLPSCNASQINIRDGRVQIAGIEDLAAESIGRDISKTLMQFHPWRKGPFKFFDCEIDTEWRSDWKWDRLQEAINFEATQVLDVGCGNGYYGWRMLDQGAEFVLGCDPFLLYVLQFEATRKYSQPEWAERHFVVPITDEELPDAMKIFDITCSMGVLYHRTSPIDHLRKLRSTLKPQGTLLLETLIIEDNAQTILVPKNRYAKMRNVWFLPSISMLELWLRRTGFKDPKVIDVSKTTIEEQRRTDWMTFESLSDFLDPNDHERTIEGYPAPRRVIIQAEAT